MTNFGEDFVKTGRSCRQGDPLNPCLFILTVEPLAKKICDSESIESLTVGNNTVNIGMYPDDTFLVLKGSGISLKVLQLFYKYSGLKINIQNTKLYGLVKAKVKKMHENHGSLT